jgi:hypothetical protein
LIPKRVRDRIRVRVRVGVRVRVWVWVRACVEVGATERELAFMEGG